MTASYTTELPAIVSKPKTCHWQGKYRLVTYLLTILPLLYLVHTNSLPGFFCPCNPNFEIKHLDITFIYIYHKHNDIICKLFNFWNI